MKKTLCIFLSVLMIMFSALPAMAADNDFSHTVTFVQPSERFEGEYFFVKSVNGETQFVKDPNGSYVLYRGVIIPYDDILDNYKPESPVFYSPDTYDPQVTVSGGELFTFKVYTSEKYNSSTATVMVNGEKITANANGEYAVFVNRDLSINVVESDENGDLLLRNHFNVKLPSGDGYNVKTLAGESYSVVYYGDSFYFRIKLKSGYSASGISVSVSRGADVLGEYIGGDLDFIGNLMGESETLISYGVDAEGCRLYKIDNVTSDCKVSVSGVKEEGFAKILSVLKRIIKMLLDAFGIEFDGLKITNEYTVEIQNNCEDVTYKVLTSDSEEINPKFFKAMHGDGVTLLVTKLDPDKEVTVSWSPSNEDGTAYSTEWISAYDYENARTYYTAVYNLDGIYGDAVISING